MALAALALTSLFGGILALTCVLVLWLLALGRLRDMTRHRLDLRHPPRPLELPQQRRRSLRLVFSQRISQTRQRAGRRDFRRDARAE